MAATDQDKQRLWNAVGGLVFGSDGGSENAPAITLSKGADGRLAIDARPTQTATSDVLFSVGSVQVTWPALLLAVAVGLVAGKLIGAVK